MASSGGKGSGGGAKSSPPSTGTNSKGTTNGSFGERGGNTNPRSPTTPLGNDRRNTNAPETPQGPALRQPRPRNREEEDSPHYPSSSAITRYPPASPPPQLNDESPSGVIDAMIDRQHRSRQAEIDKQQQEKLAADKRFCNDRVDREIARLEKEMKGLNPEQRLDFLHDSTIHPKGEEPHSGRKSGQTSMQAADAHLNEVRSQTFNACMRDTTKQRR